MPDSGFHRPLLAPRPSRGPVLRPWTVITLVLSGAIVSLGAAVGGGGSELAWLGTPLVVLGSSCAAVCVTLWAVCALDPKRRAAPVDSQLVARLVTELVDAAKAAENRGVLTLPDRSISVHQSLFAAGAGLLIAGQPAEAIRTQLAGMADTAADADAPRRARVRLICDAFPIGALSLAFSMVLWTVLAIVREVPLGTLMPLVLLGSVYGAFAFAALAVEIGDRLGASSAEDELSSALVIETLVRIRSGESAERIAERLRVRAPGVPVPVQAATLRKAA